MQQRYDASWMWKTEGERERLYRDDSKTWSRNTIIIIVKKEMKEVMVI